MAERGLKRDGDSEKSNLVETADRELAVVGDPIMDWTTIGSSRSSRKGENCDDDPAERGLDRVSGRGVQISPIQLKESWTVSAVMEKCHVWWSGIQ